MMIHGSGVIFYTDCGLGQDSFVLCHNPLGNSIGINLEPMGFIGPVVSILFPPPFTLSSLLAVMGCIMWLVLSSIIPDDIVIPGVSRFRIFHIP